MLNEGPPRTRARRPSLASCRQLFLQFSVGTENLFTLPGAEIFEFCRKFSIGGSQNTDRIERRIFGTGFAAGDCRRKAVRQLTTATADGTVAALAALAYLDA